MLIIKKPVRIDQWKTSDGKVHPNEDLARRHEVFLVVKDVLPNGTSGSAAHAIITALAAHYDFVPRSANGEFA